MNWNPRAHPLCFLWGYSWKRIVPGPCCPHNCLSCCRSTCSYRCWAQVSPCISAQLPQLPAADISQPSSEADIRTDSFSLCPLLPPVLPPFHRPLPPLFLRNPEYTHMCNFSLLWFANDTLQSWCFLCFVSCCQQEIMPMDVCEPPAPPPTHTTTSTEMDALAVDTMLTTTTSYDSQLPP